MSQKYSFDLSFLTQISKEFRISGSLQNIQPHGKGHINDTFVATYENNQKLTSYIHQRINPTIFKNPLLLMENVSRITQHLENKIRQNKNPRSRSKTLTLIPTHQNELFHVDAQGHCWRTYLFIEKSRTLDLIQSPEEAYEIARAFGEFQSLLSDFPIHTLHETIPHFHHTPKYFEKLRQTISQNPQNRLVNAQKEVHTLLNFEPISNRLLSLQQRGEIPLRVTHNDTKPNNVLLDVRLGKSLCVIDLDTVMPGLVLYDFGDMIRSMGSSVTEDEKDPSKIIIQKPLVQALLQGYLETAGAFLTRREKELLIFSGKLIAIELAVRFLTDYLQGDVYFKIQRDSHNLERCRTQLMLTNAFTQQENELSLLLRPYLG